MNKASKLMFQGAHVGVGGGETQKALENDTPRVRERPLGGGEGMSGTILPREPQRSWG